jgi:hypothetical protein
MQNLPRAAPRRSGGISPGDGGRCLADPEFQKRFIAFGAILHRA